MDAITSTTLNPSTNTAKAPQAEVSAQGAPATANAAGGEKPAVVVDLSPDAKNPKFLKDLPEEEQQRIQELRAEQKASFDKMRARYNGDPSVKAKYLVLSSSATEETILTEDDRIVTKQRRKLDEAEIARMRALHAQHVAERTQREEEAKAWRPLQAEWDAKWKGPKEVWTGELSATESKVAHEVATVEGVLSNIRRELSYLYSANFHLRNQDPWELETRPDSMARERAAAPAKIARSEAAIAGMVHRLQTDYGFKLEGNLVEKTADGFTREGRYTLTKNTGAWSIKADSEEGVFVSLGGQPYTRDFKRLAVIDPGAVIWQLKNRPAAE